MSRPGLNEITLSTSNMFPPHGDHQDTFLARHSQFCIFLFTLLLNEISWKVLASSNDSNCCRANWTCLDTWLASASWPGGTASTGRSQRRMESPPASIQQFVFMSTWSLGWASPAPLVAGDGWQVVTGLLTGLPSHSSHHPHLFLVGIQFSSFYSINNNTST